MGEELWRTNNSCTGTQSYLHRLNWIKHVEKRPELSDQLQSVQATVEDPDFALRSDRGVIFKYRLGFGTGNLVKLRLLVIEEPGQEGLHYVKTMYFTPTIKDEPVLCINRIV